jgi:RNA polymerase sigma-70 factor (ECF subfamily)
MLRSDVLARADRAFQGVVPLRPSVADPTAEDALLVKRAQQGDQHAFAALVDKYQSKVYGIIYRICGDTEDVQDLGQDVFLRALAALRKFQYHGEASFRTWLYRIAVNACINDLRRRKRRQKVEAPSLDEQVSVGEGSVERAIPDCSQMPHEVAERRETQQFVYRLLQMLSPHHRAVLTLVDLQQLSYEEAAAALGCSLGTLKSRLSRARSAFKAKYDRYGRDGAEAHLLARQATAPSGASRTP